ncbi:MAK10-like protein [Tanacetum coccineum]
MGDENPICTLGDYSKLRHEGYRNTIELPVGNNVVPLRSDTIRLVQNGCSFHGLRSEDPNQHLKDFIKLVDSLDLNGDNRERMRLRLFQFSLRDLASNWLERLPTRSITIWEDLTTRFLAQFFPPGRTAKLRNDILMFQQHHGESLSEAWTRFKDLLQKVPHHGIDLWLQALLEDLALYDNESWNDPRDFAKPVKEIALPQDVPSTSDRRLIELKNQVQRLMEAHLAPTQPTQVNKITTLCEICSGPHDTQYCMEDPEQAFVEYASSRTDEAGGKWYTFKPEQNNLGDTYNPSWRSHPNLRWRQPQNSQNNFSNPPNWFQPNGSIQNRSFNNRPQNFNNQTNIEGLVSEFIASQDARLSKFEADFKRQQGEMTHKIDIVLKAIFDQIAGTLPSDTVKNSKLGTHLVSSARSYPTTDPQCSTKIHSSINTITIHPKKQSDSHNNSEENEEEERGSLKNHPDSPTPPDPSISFITKKVLKFNSLFESLRLVPLSPNTELVCTKEEDGDVMFIEIISKDDNSHKEEPKAGVQEVEYFDIFPTRSELSKLNLREDSNGGVSNLTGRIKRMHVFIGNFTYIVDFMIVEDISSIIDPRLSQVVLGRPFIEISNMTHDPPEGVVRFINGTNEVAHKIEQYDSLSDLEKEHTKSVYLRNEEDKKRGVEYVMSKILGFYKECLELRPEYLRGMDDEGEVT